MHLLLGEMMGGNLVRAFCWTLIHSLWQGLAIAIIAGVVIMRTRKLSPAMRYGILTALFCFFLVLSLATFIREWNFPARQLPGEQPGVGINWAIGTPGSFGTVGSPSDKVRDDLVSQLIYYFNTHASLVVLAWLIVFSARFVRMMANMHYIHKIRTQKVSSPPDFWKIRIRELARQLMISRPVTLFESKIVKVPVMVGLVKPVILFPFALLAQLPPEQVEAILLHELAHIRRRDYFVNLLQHLAETVFFFNPGLLWLSSLIREERENCCDDIAIGQTQSKKQFVNALVAFQEYHLLTPRYANAFPGTQNHLLQRVKRILNNDNKTLDMREKLFLVACVAIVGFFTIAYSQSQKKPAVATKNKVPVAAVADTLPAVMGPGYTIYDKKGFQIVTKDDSLISVQLNGKKMTAGQMAEMKPLIDDIISRSKKEEDELALNEKLRAESGANLALQSEKREAEMAELSKKMAEDAELTQRLMADKNQAFIDNEKRLAELSYDKSNMDFNQKQLQEMKNMDMDQKQLQELKKMEMDQRNLELTERTNDLQKELKLLQMQDTLNNPLQKLQSYDQLDLQKRQAELSYELSRVQQQQKMVELQKMQLDKLNTNAMAQWKRSRNKYIDPIISDLFEEKVITTRDNISFKLDTKQLTVNGVKQPESLHKKLQDKYLAKEKDIISYSLKNGSESMQINTDGKK